MPYDDPRRCTTCGYHAVGLKQAGWVCGVCADSLHPNGSLHVRVARDGSILLDQRLDDGSLRVFALVGHMEWVEFPEGGTIPGEARGRAGCWCDPGRSDGKGCPVHKSGAEASDA